MYKKLIQRNLLIYIKDKTGIFFSFLGMFISLFIYIFFLRSNMISSLSRIDNIDRFVDTWMVAGLISIVSITSTLNAFGQKLEDKKDRRIDDFIVNGKLSLAALNRLYTCISIIEGALSTFIFSLICFGYLSLKYSYNAFNMHFVIVFMFSILLIIFSSLVFSFVTEFLKTYSSFSSLSAIVGTLTGFFSGTYIIYGELPNFMQNILRIWPGYQIAAVTRHEITKSIKIETPSSVLSSLGISSDWQKAMMVTIVAVAIVSLAIILKDFKSRY